MIKLLFSTLLFCTGIALASCSAHAGRSAKGAGKDTTYIVYGKDSAASEVNVTDGDTTIEEMELNHALIPIKR